MKSMIFASRTLLSSGLVLVLLPSLFLTLQGKPDWLLEALYQCSVLSAALFTLLLIVNEVLHRITWLWTLRPATLAVSVAAVLVGVIYLNGAAFIGANQAKEGTWHLLPLFLIHHQSTAMAVLGGITLGIHALWMSCIFLIRRWRTSGAQ